MGNECSREKSVDSNRYGVCGRGFDEALVYLALARCGLADDIMQIAVEPVETPVGRGHKSRGSHRRVQPSA